MAQIKACIGRPNALNLNPAPHVRPAETILASLPVPPSDPSLANASTGSRSTTKPAETLAFLLIMNNFEKLAELERAVERRALELRAGAPSEFNLAPTIQLVRHAFLLGYDVVPLPLGGSIDEILRPEEAHRMPQLHSDAA